jgi:hypothetical protein
MHSIADDQHYPLSSHSGQPSGLVEVDPIEDLDALDGIQDVHL